MNKRYLLGLLGLLILTGCQAPTEIDIPITIPSQPTATVEEIIPTPIPPVKTLFVCMQQEPESLYIYNEAYLYGDTGDEANTILQALYDGPFELLQDEIRPVILEDLPGLGAGVSFDAVEVGEFEVYLNPVTLQAENLRLGDPYLPQGCRSSECIERYQGGTVTMDRMIVEFRLREAVTWSDGQPLTAEDSVLSYTLDRSADTPTTKYLVDRTASYEALDERSVRWTGIPGFSDLEYQMIFWHPLPAHRYRGLTAADLQQMEEANRAPIGWGPYVLKNWVVGDRIEMAPNPGYFRAGDGLPYFDQLIFRFLGSDTRAALQQLLTTECDVLDESLLPQEIWPTLLEYQADERLQLFATPAAEMVRLDFNTAPLGRAGEAFFQTTEARQAVAACIDRDRLVELSVGSLGLIPESFHGGGTMEHLDLTRYAFDPQRGQELLRFLGWVEDEGDPEAARVGWGVPGVYNGTRFEVTLAYPEADSYQILAGEIQTMLSSCGIEVTPQAYSTVDLTLGYPDGSIFGRGFDMVLWSWPDWRWPLCEMFATREIPSSSYPYGTNASSFSDPAYDMACDRLLLGDFDHVDESLSQIQSIFHDQLPALPLVQPSRLLVTGLEVCGVEMDPIVPSLLWNLEDFASGEGCR